MADISIEEIREAATILRGVARVTPVLPAHWLEALVNGPVHLKCENLQRSGSFKLRGAYVRISRLNSDERSRGVVAASAGNHGQGVALAASQLGIAATVFMPRTAALPKVEATRAYGATVELVGETVEEALLRSTEYAAATGAELIHPFDHRDIVLGQGTVGLELVEQIPDVATVVVPTGGGGLLAGTALAVKALRPNARVVGVQATGAAPMPASLAARVPVAMTTKPATMADGIAVGRPGDIPVALAAPLVDLVQTVSEGSLANALVQTLERAKLLAEPAGVAGVAAILDNPELFEPPVAVILSGGNLDPVLLNRVIHHGLATAGRFVAITVRMDDRPGLLAALLGRLAESEVNVLDVSHVRSDARLAIGEVEAVILLETRGPDHRDAAIEHLRADGYRVGY
jgi:threonine dehydratase